MRMTTTLAVVGNIFWGETVMVLGGFLSRGLIVRLLTPSECDAGWCRVSQWSCREIGCDWRQRLRRLTTVFTAAEHTTLAEPSTATLSLSTVSTVRPTLPHRFSVGFRLGGATQFLDDGKAAIQCELWTVAMHCGPPTPIFAGPSSHRTW